MRVNIVALIPAYNEEAVIAETINSLFSAGMPPQKIIVINDASKDRTAEIARGLGVHVIDNEINMGKAQGVTNALRIIFSDPRYKNATHIAFLDADTLVDSKYFRTVRKRLSEDLKQCEKAAKKGTTGKPISVLCGRPRSIPHNWLTAFRAYEFWLSHAIHKSAQAKFRAITVSPGCASTYSVDALEKVRWTDDTVTEDMDATIQIALAGGRVVYEGQAIVYTQDPRTIRDYVGQVGKRWYPGTWQVLGKHGLLWKGIFSGLHWECRLTTLEPLIYIAMLSYISVSHPGSLFKIFGGLFLLVMVLASLASWREKRLDILKYFPLFPLISFANLFLFAGTGWNITGRKKSERREWFTPQRYAMNMNEKGVVS